MRVSIIMPGHVAVDDHAMPVDLSKVEGASTLFADPAIIAINWNGSVGVIQRKSKVDGHVDTEHFADETLMAPYAAAWKVESDRIEAERAEQQRVIDEINADTARRVQEAKDRAAEDTKVAGQIEQVPQV